MKVRNGFVSNSSSSSFTCDVCNITRCKYDASPEDVGMIKCERDHIFCRDHAVKPIPYAIYYPKIEEIFNFFLTLTEDDFHTESGKKHFIEVKEELEETNIKSSVEYFFGETFPGSYCPICMKVVTSESNVRNYYKEFTDFLESKNES